MPPQIPRAAIGLRRLSRLPTPPKRQQTCPICSLSRSVRRSTQSRRPQLPQLRTRARPQSNVASAAAIKDNATSPRRKPRIELREALIDLQENAASYVNISRLQLALRSLEQKPGDETIRIAILGLADGGASMKKAKELLRLLAADPLKPEEEWERILVDHQHGEKPLLLRVGHEEGEESTAVTRLVQELHVSSPMLNGHKLEILVVEMDPPANSALGEEGSFVDAVLVPTMEIPTSNTGRYAPVTTPVHKSLIVSEGITGAASLLSYPIDTDRDIVGTAVDLKVGTEAERSSLPFQVVDVDKGSAALESFRESVDNALSYEQNWFASGVPNILDWLKTGTSSTDGSMKLPVQKLLESLLANANLAIEAEQTRQLSAALSSKLSSEELAALRQGLAKWAEIAHTELRDQLDVAFDGRRWRKLGWWKLFWRVDDVSMIAGDILNERFLTEAEKDIIFLAGRIEEAGVLKDIQASKRSNDWAYKPVSQEVIEPKLGHEPPPPQIQDLIESKDHLPTIVKDKPWPLHIPATRAYLSRDTVPALQALAQRLVLQTLTTSSFASVFAGLMYVSTLSTGLYEAGAVAALGIVWSMRRMQGKWETARKFWEGEVREEGRKALRAVEGVVGEVLTVQYKPFEGDAELEGAKEAVGRVEAALEACK
jgi:hypothetical protein